MTNPTDSSSNIAGGPSRRRVRREGRRFDDVERGRVAVQKPPAAEPRLPTKNPMRLVPDLRGFTPLSKSEIKRDTREVEKFSMFKSSAESESEDEFDDSFITKSINPSCNVDSTLHKKRRRFLSWNAHPQLIAPDLQKYKLAADRARQELESLQADEERWARCFDLARLQLGSSLSVCQRENDRLQLDAERLYELSVVECGPGVRKRRNLHMRDILEELDFRQEQLESVLEEYCEVAKKACSSSSSSSSSPSSSSLAVGAAAAPVVEVTLEELDYAEDAVCSRLPAAEAPTVKASPMEPKPDPAVAVAVADPCSKPSTANEDGAKNHSRLRTRRARKLDGDDEEETVEGAEDNRSKSCSEFMAQFAAIESSIRVSESAADDVTPFFTDDGDAGNFNPTLSKLAAEQCSKKGSKSLPYPYSSNGAALSGRGPAASTSSSSTVTGVAAGTPTASTVPSAATVGDSTSTSSSMPSASASGSTLPYLWDSIKEKEKEKKLAEPFAAPRSIDDWAEILTTACQEEGSAAAPRRKSNPASSAIDVASFVFHRTPRDVPLLVTPLSQFEDRYLGAVAGPAPHNTSADVLAADGYLPAELVSAENDAILRCRLQSLAAQAQTKIARLRTRNADLLRQRGDAGLSLRKAQGLFSQARRDTVLETKWHRRELYMYGLLARKETDPPLSPIEDYTSLLVALNKGSSHRQGTAHRSSGGGGGGGAAKRSNKSHHHKGTSSAMGALVSFASALSSSPLTVPGADNARNDLRPSSRMSGGIAGSAVLTDLDTDAADSELDMDADGDGDADGVKSESAFGEGDDDSADGSGSERGVDDVDAEDSEAWSAHGGAAAAGGAGLGQTQVASGLTRRSSQAAVQAAARLAAAAVAALQSSQGQEEPGMGRRRSSKGASAAVAAVIANNNSSRASSRKPPLGARRR